MSWLAIVGLLAAGVVLLVAEVALLPGLGVAGVLAGLLLCGDLAVALAWIKRESRAIAELTSEDRRRDLLAFSASAELAALRERLAVGATNSTHPPPPSSAAPASAG